MTDPFESNRERAKPKINAAELSALDAFTVQAYHNAVVVKVESCIVEADGGVNYYLGPALQALKDFTQDTRVIIDLEGVPVQEVLAGILDDLRSSPPHPGELFLSGVTPDSFQKLDQFNFLGIGYQLFSNPEAALRQAGAGDERFLGTENTIYAKLEAGLESVRPKRWASLNFKRGNTPDPSAPQVEQHDDVVLVRIMDRTFTGGLQKSDALAERILEAIGDAKKVVIDFDSMEEANADILGALHQVVQKVEARGGSCLMCNVRDGVAETFHTTRMDSLFDIRASTTEALEAARKDLS